MSRRRSLAWLAGVMMLFGILGGPVREARADRPEIFPLSQVKRGLKGYGMTTFQGTTPERFDFEVVGVAKNFLPDLDIIIVKSDDPKMQLSGFWAGMSGSPLYIDGKLLCAFSYGFPFNKSALGGCTPLESMLKDASTPLRGNTDVVKAEGGSGKTKHKKGKGASAMSTATAPTEVATLDDWKKLTPSSDVGEALDKLGAARAPWLLSTPLPDPVTNSGTVNESEASGTMQASVPLSIAGAGNAEYQQLSQLFAGYGVDPMRASGTGGPSVDGPKEFQMGASISVELIRGDLSANGTGTVSYIDGSTLLAFGHPMFQMGETYAPVATAEIIGIVASAQSPHVLAQALNEAGALVQDRQSMIEVDTHLRHPMIPVDIYLSSGTGKDAKTSEFHTEVWNNKFFTAALAGVAAENAIDVFLPDHADATAKIESTVKIRGEKPIEFTDYLYANDGAGSIIGGARGLRALVPLIMNPWAPVEIDSVKIKVDLSFDTNYGDVKELRLPGSTLEPGKSYVADVVMESYDKKDVVEHVPFDVPLSLAGQVITVEVTAGDAARLDAAPAVDLPSLMSAIRQLLPGNVWAVSLYGSENGASVNGVAVKDLPESAQDKLHPQTSTQNVDDYRAIARTTSPASLVINGSASTVVRIADVKR